MPTLYILRHGKAENTSPDFERNLSSEGKANIQTLAEQLKVNHTHIDKAIYSPAARAKQTAQIVCDALNISAENRNEDKRIYNASVIELQTVLSEMDASLESILLVGHNPGFADLVLTLCEEPVHLSAGNIAVVAADSWNDIHNCNCRFTGKF